MTRKKEEKKRNRQERKDAEGCWYKTEGRGEKKKKEKK